MNRKAPDEVLVNILERLPDYLNTLANLIIFYVRRYDQKFIEIDRKLERLEEVDDA